MGLFMKPGMPFPDGLGYFDIQEIIVATRQAESFPTYQVMTEVYRETVIAKESVHSVIWYYTRCRKA